MDAPLTPITRSSPTGRTPSAAPGTERPVAANTPAIPGPGAGACATGLLSVANRPSPLPVPNKIHMYWQGSASAFARHLQTVTAIAESNPAWRSRLHMMADTPADAAGIHALLCDSGVKVKALTAEGWFQAFQQTPRYRQFQAACTGSRAHAAAAADVIKTELLARKGGVWSDVDNLPLLPMPATLEVAPGGVLTAGPARFTRWGGQRGVHCSTLATHAQNATLDAINTASFDKFRKLEGVLFASNAVTDDPDRHFQLISETGGSVHLSQELMQRDAGFRDEVERLHADGARVGERHAIFDACFKPQATTGCGTLDEAQILTLLERLSPPGHVVI